MKWILMMGIRLVNLRMKDNFQFKTKPFDGYKMGTPFIGSMVVAIPQKRLEEARKTGRELMVINRDTEKNGMEFMVFDGSEIPESFGTFKDKFRNNEEYTLFYFKWKPQKQLSLI